MNVVTALANWLHVLATVIFVGHFVLFALIYFPALSKPGNGPALSEISRRSRNWMYAALLAFIITGIYLMVMNPNYLGIGNFSNFWGVAMLVKHLLILVMIGMGFWFNAILRVGPLVSSNSGAAIALSRFRWYVNAMALCGVFVLLLTALVQAQ